MSLTDAEIIELEQHLRDKDIHLLKKGLTDFDEKTNINYKVLFDSLDLQKWGFNKDGKPKLLSGYSGTILEGGSRSGKTWSWIFFIVYLCLVKHKNESIKINIYREHFADFQKTLFDDFKRVLDMFDLPNKFHNAEIVKSFKIGKSTIYLLGCDKLKGSGHGSGSDYSIFNEMMFIDKKTFLQAVKRCRIFWLGDYNPSFTQHWVFNNVIPRPDVNYQHSTLLDNPHISPKEKQEILITEPWLPNSYDVIEGELYYQDQPITETNQPPPHPENVKNGTADEFEWTVYGLGLRGAMTGVIIKQLDYIEEFPNIAYTYANDFGFTNDPNVLVKYAEDENNIWFEVLTYHSIETPESLDDNFNEIGVEKYAIISCDSADKHTSETKGAIEMVLGLQELGYYNAKKISKTHSIMYWLTSMRRKKLHCIKDAKGLWKQAKKERENYKFKEVNDIPINQPEDKFNHIWDAVRYGHMSHNTNIEIEAEWN